MQRTILHVDMNCFYAGVEMLHHPELDGQPLAVCGDPQKRHGIVLTANYIAKGDGVKTGMALWQARQVCPRLVLLPARMDLYLRFSRMAQEIYREYTDLVEPYGIDESWLDVTASAALRGSGMEIARQISRRVKRELGVSVSIGVSWNKIFAKLGSDYKKPDAITEITQENYRTLVWALPVTDLLYIGKATGRKLRGMGIFTIGELAQADPQLLEDRLGKMGVLLHIFANGRDASLVCADGWQAPVKSVGNSVTAPRDLVSETDVKILLMAITQSVARRLREYGFRCRTVEISVRDDGLRQFTRQRKLPRPTNLTDEIMETAYTLFLQSYRFEHPVRSLGVRGCELVAEDMPYQMDLFTDEERMEKLARAERAADEIRRRFGDGSITRACMYQDRLLAGLDTKMHTQVHPPGFGAPQPEDILQNI